MSKITIVEVQRLATLARIGVTEAEAKSLAGELDQIVGFVEQLGDVDLADVAQTSQVTGLVNVTREDEVKPGLSHEDLRANAPDWQDNQFKVKRVLG